MSDLEKYIIKMKDKLDGEEPSGGHLKRFSQRLNQQDRPKVRINFRHALQIAASIAIIVASGVVIVKSGKSGHKMAAAPVPEEFVEARNYYATQVDLRYDDIAGLPFNSNKEKEVLLQELKEMDDYYKELLEEFNANPGDERVMNAMIQHYQIKIRVMDQIIDQLKQLNDQNTTQYEKSDI